MKVTFTLIAFLTLSACQTEDSDIRDAREYAVSLTKEAMCKNSGKAEAISQIAETAAAVPSADVAKTVYEVANRIEKTGCEKIIKKHAKRWGSG